MPVDRSVEFEMESADVIHSLWIPQMGQKQDVVPGVDDGDRDHADEDRAVHAHLHRALRPRPLDDARARCACSTGGVRGLARGAAGGAGGQAPARVRRRRERGGEQGGGAQELGATTFA